MTNLINLALYAIIGYFLIKNKDQVGQFITKLVPGGGGGGGTVAPSVGGGSIITGGGWQSVPAGKLEKHGFASSGKTTLREEFGVTQTSDNFAFDLRFKFAEATNDQCTLEFAGKPHSGGNDRSGYKFRLGEDGKGSYLQKQSGTSYGPKLGSSGVNLTLGHEYIARAVKQNIMNGSQCVGVHLEGWLQDVTAGGAMNKICEADDRSSPFCNISGSRVGARQDGRKNSSVHFFIAYRQTNLGPVGSSGSGGSLGNTLPSSNKKKSGTGRVIKVKAFRATIRNGVVS